jgi:hypothetical protein
MCLIVVTMPPGKNPFAVIMMMMMMMMMIIIIIIIRVCKGWTKNYQALALPRSILLPLVVHPPVNPTLLMKGRTFLIGTSW